MKKVKTLYLTDPIFQNAWFSTPSGSNGNESETDYLIIKCIYDYITKDKDKIREIFEKSEYFSKKDKKHINKWTYNNYRYYNFIYSRLI